MRISQHKLFRHRWKWKIKLAEILGKFSRWPHAVKIESLSLLFRGKISIKANLHVRGMSFIFITALRQTFWYQQNGNEIKLMPYFISFVVNFKILIIILLIFVSMNLVGIVKSTLIHWYLKGIIFIAIIKSINLIL